MSSESPGVFLRRSLVTRLHDHHLDPGAPASCGALELHTQPGRRRHHRDAVCSGVHCSVLRKRSPTVALRAAAGRSLLRPAERVTPPSSSAPGPSYRRLETCMRLGRAFENCIASTSVLYITLWSSTLRLLLPRRVEECAISSYKEPTVDALAPDADEGRGWLRKATGSCLPSFDPWISEWGNPAGVMPSHSCLNT